MAAYAIRVIRIIVTDWYQQKSQQLVNKTPKAKSKFDLSAALAKSGPLDFPSEKKFLLFFAHEKGLGHMFQK